MKDYFNSKKEIITYVTLATIRAYDAVRTVSADLDEKYNENPLLLDYVIEDMKFANYLLSEIYPYLEDKV